MTPRPHRAPKAYKNKTFMESTDARALRILAEYLEPEKRFDAFEVKDTIVFFGSSRIVPREVAEKELKAAKKGKGDLEKAEIRFHMSRYYEDARELARRLTLWSKGLKDKGRRFVICSGGGPGIMEAANRGASEAKGVNIGLNISVPFEQYPNDYITRNLNFEFHYFFMRKFWFAYFAKLLIAMPGGFGTMDELMEMLTLTQTLKIRKRLPIVLYGSEYWDEVLDLDAMVKFDAIERRDLDLMFRTDSVDEAYEFITADLTKYALAKPGAML